MKYKTEVKIRVFNKFNQHCAYCGCDLDYNKMQIDHINPIYRKTSQKELDQYGIIKGVNSIENYNPSCGSCNSSKSTFTIEKWRKEIELKKDRLQRDSSTFRILKRFGIVEVIDRPIKFYFEKHNYGS